MPGSTLIHDLHFFLETVPGDSLAESRAYLTRVDSWLDLDDEGRPCRATGGGQVLSGRVGTQDDPTTETFVPASTRLDGFPLTWEQLFHNSPESPGRGGTRDISKWLRWMGTATHPAGCRFLPGPDGTAQVLHPDGSLETIYQPVAN